MYDWFTLLYRRKWYNIANNSSVQSLSHVQLFATPCTEEQQASLSITNSQSLLKLMPIKSVMPSTHLILCHPLLLLPPIFPSIRVFSNESVLCITWPEYGSFSFSISPSNEYSGLISFWSVWFDLLVVQGTLKNLLLLISQFKSINSLVLTFLYGPTLTSIVNKYNSNKYSITNNCTIYTISVCTIYTKNFKW